MKFRIRTKLIILLVGLTGVVLTAVLSAVNNTFSSTINEDIVLDFSQLQGFFRKQQSLQYDRLVESAYLISENSTFKANVELGDAPTMQQSIQEFAYFIKADLFVVTDPNGTVLAWLNNPGKSGASLVHRPSISQALQGIEPSIEVIWPELWAIDGELYQVVSIPVYLGDIIIGTTTLGSKFQDTEASALKQNTPLEVVMYLDDQPIAYSTTSREVESLRAFAQTLTSTIDTLVSSLEITPPFRSNLYGEEILAFMSPLGESERAFYLAYVPVKEQFQILDILKKNIIIIALICIAIVIPLAYFIARAFSQPIQSLTKAMLEVRQGKLDIEVQPRTDDEVGILTRTFNEMIVGLRERFALSKYVGDHTLEMIKSTSDSEVKLGGSRKKLAILFTDIRGSTATLEKTDPTEFIRHLNKTLSHQADCARKFNGSIDKFVGDSMIALFSGPDCIDRALKCSIAIQRQFQKDRQNDGIFRGLGIGVNYGEMVLGNMGAKERMDYTVIGPEVNLCARLCSEADDNQILISEELVQKFHLDTKFKFGSKLSKSMKGFSQNFDVVEVHYD